MFLSFLGTDTSSLTKILSSLFHSLWGNLLLYIEDHLQRLRYTLFPSADFYIPFFTFTTFFPYTVCEGIEDTRFASTLSSFREDTKSSPAIFFLTLFTTFPRNKLIPTRSAIYSSCFAQRKRPLTFSRFVMKLSQRSPFRPNGRYSLSFHRLFSWERLPLGYLYSLFFHRRHSYWSLPLGY